jgi:hypothetical protein
MSAVVRSPLGSGTWQLQQVEYTLDDVAESQQDEEVLFFWIAVALIFLVIYGSSR